MENNYNSALLLSYNEQVWQKTKIFKSKNHFSFTDLDLRGKYFFKKLQFSQNNIPFMKDKKNLVNLSCCFIYYYNKVC